MFRLVGERLFRSMIYGGMLGFLRMRNGIQLIEFKEHSNKEGWLRSHLFREDSNLLRAIHLFWKFHLNKTNISFTIRR